MSNASKMNIPSYKTHKNWFLKLLTTSKIRNTDESTPMETPKPEEIEIPLILVQTYVQNGGNDCRQKNLTDKNVPLVQSSYIW